MPRILSHPKLHRFSEYEYEYEYDHDNDHDHDHDHDHDPDGVCVSLVLES